ncbi:MAG: pyridoxamine 5'-phosphate oxidase family protein [Alphaproteobacteria bacterium]
MTARYAEVLFTDAMKSRQSVAGSRKSYDRMAALGGNEEDALGEAEAAFIAARDSFYIANVTADGWPYMQHRGGPIGFLKVTGPRTLAFAEFAGNKQFVSAGNVDGDDRVSLSLMDCPGRRRLKMIGHARLVERGDPGFPNGAVDAGYNAPVERARIFDVVAFDWNCPKHITPRYIEAEIAPGVNELLAKIADLEARLELADYSTPVPPSEN